MTDIIIDSNQGPNVPPLPDVMAYSIALHGTLRDMLPGIHSLAMVEVIEQVARTPGCTAYNVAAGRPRETTKRYVLTRLIDEGAITETYLAEGSRKPVLHIDSDFLAKLNSKLTTRFLLEALRRKVEAHG